MPDNLVVVGLAVAAALFWFAVGLGPSRRLFSGPIAVALAPALGWSLHSAIALPIALIFNASRPTVVVTGLLALLVSTMMISRRGSEPPAERPGMTRLTPLLAAIVAIGPTLAVLPKTVPNGVILAGPIFDHSKIALIDQMVRSGVPPQNPFIGGADGAHLAYYYLWHFSAAEMALISGVSGWTADAALTGVTAWISLLLMAGAAVWASRRPSAGYWVLLIALTASLWPVLRTVIDHPTLYQGLQRATGFGGWLFQASWAPQHLASATSALLALLLIARLRQTPTLPVALALAVVAAASLQSSIWIGGIAFPLMALVVTALLLSDKTPLRGRFVGGLAVSALLAVALASPLLRDQIAAATARGGASVVTIAAYPVLGPAFGSFRSWLNVPAYWLALLVIEFPVPYLIGGFACVAALRTSSPSRTFAPAVAAAFISLAVGATLRSTLGDNNDLAWRAVLPAVMILMIAAASGLSSGLSRSSMLRHPAALFKIALVALALPSGGLILASSAVGSESPEAARFADSVALWQAVRNVAGPTDRVADNPMALASLTGWPVNIGWALLSDRPSCFAGRELAIAFAPLLPNRRDEVEALFNRVFAGLGSADDITQLATTFDCRVVVMTAQDGAWNHDSFASSTKYHLVDQRPGQWRLYRRS